MNNPGQEFPVALEEDAKHDWKSEDILMMWYWVEYVIPQ